MQLHRNDAVMQVLPIVTDIVMIHDFLECLLYEWVPHVDKLATAAS